MMELEIISLVLINFLRIIMSVWETTLKLTNQYGKSKPIKINSSIFPGDSLFFYPCQKN